VVSDVRCRCKRARGVLDRFVFDFACIYCRCQVLSLDEETTRPRPGYHALDEDVEQKRKPSVGCMVDGMRRGPMSRTLQECHQVQKAGDDHRSLNRCLSIPAWICRGDATSSPVDDAVSPHFSPHAHSPATYHQEGNLLARTS
jgi:hypothetical protein